MFGKRKLLPKFWALSARVFFYIIEQGESTKEVSRRLHYQQTSTYSHSSPVGKTPGLEAHLRQSSHWDLHPSVCHSEVMWRSIYMELTLLPLKGECWLWALYLSFPCHHSVSLGSWFFRLFVISLLQLLSHIWDFQWQQQCVFLQDYRTSLSYFWDGLI